MCRINRKRTWAARIELEASAYRESCFVTLTYAPEHVPADGSLSPVHWRQFTKGIGYRYFGCGEYGDRSDRPHYHLVIFGLPVLQAEKFLAARWPYGFVCVRPYVSSHGLYVAAYTTKKMTGKDDDRLRPGQCPEFARMSRRPAIGTAGIAPFEKWITTRGGVDYVSRHLDVPSTVRINGAFYPLGRTLKGKIRDAADIPSDVPRRTALRELAFRISRSDAGVNRVRERRRVTQYERRRALARRPHGQI
jgi:hypothetical protein